MGEEDRLSGKHALPGAHEFPYQALIGFGSVSHLGFVVDSVFHVVHCPRFGHDGLVGVQLDFDDLHVVAKDLIIDFMALHVRFSLAEDEVARGVLTEYHGKGVYRHAQARRGPVLPESLPA